jgi:hypothetical protein
MCFSCTVVNKNSTDKNRAQDSLFKQIRSNDFAACPYHEGDKQDPDVEHESLAITNGIQ